MSSELINRVASAISLASPSGHAPITTDMARAAIAAMREPTEAMICAGEEEHNGDPGAADPMWRAMIDSALKDPDLGSQIAEELKEKGLA